ncbi:unnamed protein product [Withania somnifera]
MERGKENEGEREDREANSSSVSSVVLREDIVSLLDFIERLKNQEEQIVLDTDQIENLKLELTFLSACLKLCYYISDDSNADMSCISYEVHDLVQLLFHQNGDDMLVKLKDLVVPRLLENIKVSIISDHSESRASMNEDQLVELLDAILTNLHYLPKIRAEWIFPSMAQYELLQNVFGNLRDFHGLIVNDCIEHKTIEYVLPQFQLMAERVGHFCFTLLSYQFDDEYEAGLAHSLEFSRVNSKLAYLLVEVIPIALEVMHICSTNLKASKSEEVGCFIKKLLEASPDILRESLIHLQQHMVNVITASTLTRNIHIVIEFLLIILSDVPKDVIRHDKLFVLLERIAALTKEVFVLVRNIEENASNEENMNGTSGASLNLLENIELLKEDLKNDFLKAPPDSSQLYFPMSDGPLFLTLLLRNLNDLLNSNAYSVALIKEEIGQVKEDLKLIRSFFGNGEQELHKDLWTRVLDVAFEAEHAINSILARDHGLLQLIFLLPDTIEKIILVKKEVQEKINKNTSIIVANSPNKPVESKASMVGQINVGFEEETEWIIRKLTSGPTEIDVISIVGMPGLGKTTLAYKVYTDNSVVGHFDVRAWCTVDQEHNEKKLLQKIFNQVIVLNERISEDCIDDDIADKLRKQLFGKRYLIVLDDLWDTATWDELTRPFPSEFQKGSRVILTSRKKEVALRGKSHSNPLDLRLLRPEESWELFEKRVFGEEHCPVELKDVGEKIAQKCNGLPLVLDLIGGVISRKGKTEALWLEVLNNLSSFIFTDEEEVMKVIELSYDHLSDHLKPCFLYLASFPKDKEIWICQLKELWVTEGLVEPTDLMSMEEVLEVYVDELISSSLVILRGRRKERCQIHDLVHDFCSIKAIKEKLFDLRSSIVLSSASSPDLMLRRRTIFYDNVRHLDDISFLFNPEKRNPFAKHLLSLDLNYLPEDDLPDNSHLKHLRLLKRLEMPGPCLTDILLNEMGMLVHLRCLFIQMESKALPQSFSNLCNLETLEVKTYEPDMVLSPCIWSLAKLRRVFVEKCSVFLSDIDKPIKLENLSKIGFLKLNVDSDDIFKRFLNLRCLKFCMYCSAEQMYFPTLDVLSKLEEVYAEFWCRERTHVHQFDFHFPSSLKEVELYEFDQTYDALSRVGRSLPNLQKLKLDTVIIRGRKEWNMKQVTFQNLKSLTLRYVSFSKWQVIADESFPMLEELLIYFCEKLKEIPESFGDIDSLKFILVWGSPQLIESALKIKEYVAEMTGEDKLEVDYDKA